VQRTAAFVLPAGLIASALCGCAAGVGDGDIGLAALAAVALVSCGGYVLALLALVTVGALTIKSHGVTASDVLLLLAALAALPRFFAKYGANKLPVALLAPLGIMALVGATSALAGAIDAVSLVFLLRYLAYLLLLPAVLVAFGDTERRLEWLAGAYVVAASVNGLLAASDYLGISHFASHLTGFAGQAHRYPGLMQYPNQLGMMCVLALPMALYLTSRHRRWVVALAALMFGVFTSGSRGAIIGVPLAALLYAGLEQRDRLRRFAGYTSVLALAAYAALFSGLTIGIQRLLHPNASVGVSDTQRKEAASLAWSQFTHAPLTGGGFSSAVAHDVYLQLLSSGGVIVLAAFLWLAGGAIRIALRSRTIGFGAAAAASLLTWLILNVQFNGYYDRYLLVPVALTYAAGRVAAEVSPEPARAANRDTPPAAVVPRPRAHDDAEPSAVERLRDPGLGRRRYGSPRRWSVASSAKVLDQASRSPNR
jgi:hypothetical protein